MEPLALSAGVFGVYVVAQKTARLLKTIRGSSDPRLEQVYWKAVAERERTLAWSNLVLHSGRPIPPGNEQKVKDLLKKMTIFYERVDKILSKLYEPTGGKMTRRFVMARLNLVVGGLEEIQNCLGAIDAGNNALHLLAPPLPGYHGDGIYKPDYNQGISTVPPGTIRMNMAYPDNTVVKLSSAAIATPATLPDKPEGAATLHEPKETLRLIARPIQISTLYRACLDTLRKISMLHLPTKQMRALLGKMELWGTGLFDEAYLELEDIITQAPNQNSIIHGMLLELFTHIIICEEPLLAAVEDQEGAKLDRSSLVAFLGNDGLMDYSFARQADLQTYYMESDDEDKVLIPSSPKSPTHIISGLTEELEGLLNNLLDLLPSIRLVRQAYRLSLEETEYTVIQPEEKKVETADTGSKTFEHKPSDTKDSKSRYVLITKPKVQNFPDRKLLTAAVDRNLLLAASLEEALRNDEEFAKAHNLGTGLISSTQVEKERKRLETFQTGLSKRTDDKTGRDEVNAVQAISDLLQKITRDLIASTDITSDSTMAGKDGKPTAPKIEFGDFIKEFQKANSVSLGECTACRIFLN